MKPIRSIVNDGIYRVSLVASTPSKFFPSLSEDVLNLMNIKNENKRLRTELEVYKKKEFNLEYVVEQNKSLKQLIDDETLFEENIIIAKVLLDKDSPYLQSIIINKGSKAGVLKGMPVLDRIYLIGRVVETNYMSSRVLLLNDLNSRIPVSLAENNIQAILKGTGKKNPILEYLPEDYNLKAGVNIFTSGKDQIFKPGTPIGVTNSSGEVRLFSEANQLSFIRINSAIQNKENF
jgi:rod shape-determining protein MreC